MGGNSLRYRSTLDMPTTMREVYQRQIARTGGPLSPINQPLTGKRAKKPPRDLEHFEQVEFFEQLRRLANMDPDYERALARTFAIPNGGHRSKRAAGRLKAEGVKPGVSDVFCALPRNGFCGLWIEMKSLEGRASREQADWISESINLGYAAHVCRGASQAVKTWQEYVLEPFPPPPRKPK